MTIDIEKPIDQRLHELESIVWSIGPTLNLRLEGIQKRFDATDAVTREFSGRMASMENQQSALQTDIRDMRGGVTRMLVAQDEIIRDLALRMERLEVAQHQLEVGQQRLEVGLQQLEAGQQRLELGQTDLTSKLEAHAAKIDATLAEILKRLPKN